MLVATNNKKRWALGWDSNGDVIWKNLRDMEESPIDPNHGSNAEGGICILMNDEKAILGIYYQTASFREILQTPNEIYLINMDNSEYFKGILEEFFGTKFIPCSDKKYLKFTVCRNIDSDEYVEYTTEDYKTDVLVHDIFKAIVNQWPKTIEIPIELFNIEKEIPKMRYDFGAYLISIRKATMNTQIKILQNIKNFLEGGDYE